MTAIYKARRYGVDGWTAYEWIADESVDGTYDAELESVAHEIWASAQLLPGEGIEDGVNRIIRILQAQKEQTE